MKANKVLITGGASGIGLLLVKKYLKRNFSVAIVDINEESLNKIKTDNKKIRTLKADLSLDDDIEKAKELIRDFQPDIFINNAGIVSGKSFIDLTKKDIEKTFSINVYAPFYLSAEALKYMLKNDSGQIVNLCSASSYVGVPKLSDYAASKAAILNMDESLRLELKQLKSNVTTTAVCPFYINTGMFDGVKTRFPFLLPILKPEYVADKIIRAIDKKKPRLIMPRFIFSIFLIKVLSPTIFDALLNFFGVNNSMEEFKGRKSDYLNSK
ncbi:SDR family oxidoreductase [Halobacteriovorax sp. GB3]|uniref:SDR family oxidoreductase n=1 Tax=Halobacteriovorax sp. GB3 TaxID=2719615 RepID=UPI00235F02C2|nr:SDR family oxidoreductase [Halobacteriovorax sp. GB3]MDD0851802.1 SDR family oxidoreductase [Halobacteriovorax sp. GB3]